MIAVAEGGVGCWPFGLLAGRGNHNRSHPVRATRVTRPEAQQSGNYDWDAMLLGWNIFWGVVRDTNGDGVDDPNGAQRLVVVLKQLVAEEGSR